MERTQYNLPVHTRLWWRQRESVTGTATRITPYLEKGWSGTLADILAMTIDNEALLWAVCQPGAMPDRLAMRCILKMVDLFPIGNPPKRLFPALAILNLSEYADGGSRREMEASRPVTIAHYGKAAQRLWTVQRHLYHTAGVMLGGKGRVFQARVVNAVEDVIKNSVTV